VFTVGGFILCEDALKRNGDRPISGSLIVHPAGIGVFSAAQSNLPLAAGLSDSNWNIHQGFEFSAAVFLERLLKGA